MLNLMLTSAAPDADALQLLVQLLLGSFLALGVIGIIWYILLVIADWRIFTKAGEPGWKSIIPVYNTYVMYKIVWKPVFFWVNVIAAAAVFIANAFLVPAGSSNEVNPVAAIVVCVGMIVSAVLYIMLCNKFSKAFGHGVGFTLGLIFLNPIFLLILGLGGSQYQGADR